MVSFVPANKIFFLFTKFKIKIHQLTLRYASPTGLLLTLVVHVVYRVALRFER